MKVRFRALEEDKYITVLDNGLKAQYHRGAPYREVYIGSDLIVKEGLIIDPDHPENTYYSAVSNLILMMELGTVIIYSVFFLHECNFFFRF